MPHMVKWALLFAIVFCFSAGDLLAQYKRDPWGSSTWTGPGRPPHWSPEPAKPAMKPGIPNHPVTPGKPVDPDYGVPPGKPGKPGHPGGYWKDNHGKWYYHRKRQPGYIYYREPREEPVVIEKEKEVIVPVYVPVTEKKSKLQCGGQTQTRKDPVTGELVIEYISGATDCE